MPAFLLPLITSAAGAGISYFSAQAEKDAENAAAEKARVELEKAKISNNELSAGLDDIERAYGGTLTNTLNEFSFLTRGVQSGAAKGALVGKLGGKLTSDLAAYRQSVQNHNKNIQVRKAGIADSTISPGAQAGAGALAGLETGILAQDVIGDPFTEDPSVGKEFADTLRKNASGEIEGVANLSAGLDALNPELSPDSTVVQEAASLDRVPGFRRDNTVAGLSSNPADYAEARNYGGREAKVGGGGNIYSDQGQTLQENYLSPASAGVNPSDPDGNYDFLKNFQFPKPGIDDMRNKIQELTGGAIDALTSEDNPGFLQKSIMHGLGFGFDPGDFNQIAPQSNVVQESYIPPTSANELNRYSPGSGTSYDIFNKIRGNIPKENLNKSKGLFDLYGGSILNSSRR